MRKKASQTAWGGRSLFDTAALNEKILGEPVSVNGGIDVASGQIRLRAVLGSLDRRAAF